MTATAPNIRRAAELFHALSDETRVSIVEMLQNGERCVCELQNALDAERASGRPPGHLSQADEDVAPHAPVKEFEA